MGRVLDGFMNVTERLQAVFGPAARYDADEPVVHKHDDFEAASEEDLAQFEIETDSEGHHYAVRKGEPSTTSNDYTLHW